MVRSLRIAITIGAAFALLLTQPMLQGANGATKVSTAPTLEKLSKRITQQGYTAIPLGMAAYPWRKEACLVVGVRVKGDKIDFTWISPFVIGSRTPGKAASAGSDYLVPGQMWGFGFDATMNYLAEKGLITRYRKPNVELSCTILNRTGNRLRFSTTLDMYTPQGTIGVWYLNDKKLQVGSNHTADVVFSFVRMEKGKEFFKEKPAYIPEDIKTDVFYKMWDFFESPTWTQYALIEKKGGD